MGRWLEIINKSTPDLLTKPTEPTLVSFVGNPPGLISKNFRGMPKHHSPSGVMTCNNCQHFISDIIGDGAGIGRCNLGIEWTLELIGRMPLFRYTIRQCRKFTSKSSSERANVKL